VESLYDVPTFGDDVSGVYGPPEILLEYTLYPTTVDVLALQDNDTE